MSVNEENFSEFEFSSMMGGQINENKSLNERTKSAGNGNEHDSTYQEIVDIIKEIEHEKKDSEDFKTLKTDVEFKLSTILNSIESPDDEIPPNDSNDDEMSSSHKLK
jgi:DNA-binding transcriptional regulator GbsR (MarR family)